MTNTLDINTLAIMISIFSIAISGIAYINTNVLDEKLKKTKLDKKGQIVKNKRSRKNEKSIKKAKPNKKAKR